MIGDGETVGKLMSWLKIFPNFSTHARSECTFSETQVLSQQP